MVSLVEALCASRGTTQVVSCLAPQDIDPERLHAPGAQLLYQLLVLAWRRMTPREARSTPIRCWWTLLSVCGARV